MTSRYKLYIPFIIASGLFSLVLGLEYYYMRTLILSNNQSSDAENFAIVQNISTNIQYFLDIHDSSFLPMFIQKNQFFFVPERYLIDARVLPNIINSQNTFSFNSVQISKLNSIIPQENIISTFVSKMRNGEFISMVLVLPSNMLNKNIEKLSLVLFIAFVIMIAITLIPAVLLIESNFRRSSVIKSLALEEISSIDQLVFKGIVNSSTVGGILFSSDGSILFANDYCKDILEIEDVVYQSRTLSSLTVLPLGIRRIDLDLVSEPYREQIDLELMNGSVMEYFLEIFPFTEENKVTSVLFLFSSISVDIHETRGKEKNQLVADVVMAPFRSQYGKAIFHKINNYLSGIIGLTTIELAKTIETERSHLSSILQSSEKLSELFSELEKSFSTGDTDLIRNPLEELDRIANILKNVLPASVLLEISGTSTSGIKVAPSVFREFFYSLVLNSTEIMNGEGRIRIEVSERIPLFNRTVDSFPIGKKICIRYSDGYIMPVATRDVFLNRNYSAIDVERLFGSTIGNIYKAINSNLGDIVFERGSGETIMCLLLDSYLLKQEETGSQKAILSKKIVDKFSVLIADKIPVVVNSTVEYLELSGIETKKAGSVSDVKSLLSKENFDAIVIGMNMLNRSTRDLVEFCQENRPEMAILITTGYDLLLEIEEFIKKPNTDYLHKPFKPSELLEKLNILLGREFS